MSSPPDGPGPEGEAASGRGAKREVPIDELRFSQASIFPTVSTGDSMDDFARKLLASGWNYDVPAPRAVRFGQEASGGSGAGPLVLFDNRRGVILKWLRERSVMKNALIQVFGPRDELLEEFKSQDHGLRNMRFARALGAEQLRAAAAACGASLEELGLEEEYEKGHSPRTWGEVVLCRTSSQAVWGAPDFPLLGQARLPWIKWDLVGPYRQHCARVAALPKDHPTVYFKAPPSIFDMRSKEALAELLRSQRRGKAAEVSLEESLQRLLEQMPLWCEDVLSDRVCHETMLWEGDAKELRDVLQGKVLRVEDVRFEESRVVAVLACQQPSRCCRPVVVKREVLLASRSEAGAYISL